jgi:predicted metal-dependent HD superfamily phosphohydrolase
LKEKIYDSRKCLSFSTSDEEYSSYCKSLQQEYGTDSFKKERLKMLKTLLMIPMIYSNAKLRAKLEEGARKNIQKEIEDLEA